MARKQVAQPQHSPNLTLMITGMVPFEMTTAPLDQSLYQKQFMISFDIEPSEAESLRLEVVPNVQIHHNEAQTQRQSKRYTYK